MQEIKQKIDFLYASKRFRDAEEFALKLALDEPTDFWVFCKLSLIYIKLKDAEKAVRFAREAVSIESENGGPFRYLGWALHFADENIEAQKVAKKAIDLEPLEPENYNLISWVLAKTEYSKEALEYVTKGLELAPEHVGLWNAKIRHLVNIEDWDSAISAIEYSLSLDSNKFFTFAALGGCYYKKNDFRRSEKYLVEALRIIPSNESAQELLKEVIFRQSIFGKIVRILIPKKLKIFP